MKKGWEYKKLMDVCDFQGGSQPPKSQWIEHECPGYIRMLQIRDFTQSRMVKPEYIKITDKIRVCNSDDIMIGRYGASVGKILTGLSGAYNVALMRSIPNEEIISKDFLKYYLKSYVFQDFLKNSIGNRAAQAGFSKEDLSPLLIPVPPLSEQQRIVSYLDSAFAKIDAVAKNAENSLNEAKALFQSALTKMMEPKEGWEEKHLDELAENFDNRRIPVKLDKRKGGQYPYYGASGIVDYVEDYIFEGNYLLISEDGANLLARATPIAFSVSGKFWVNNHAHILKFNNSFTQQYVEYYFKSINIKEYVTGAAQPKLTQRNLNKIPINIPSINEQQLIVGDLRKLENIIQQLKANLSLTLTECTALKQAILRQTFEQDGNII
jgi:type I restriction enzyme S subunit